MNRKRTWRPPWQMSKNVGLAVHDAAFERSVMQQTKTNLAYFRAKKERPQDGNPIGRKENKSLT